MRSQNRRTISGSLTFIWHPYVSTYAVPRPAPEAGSGASVVGESNPAPPDALAPEPKSRKPGPSSIGTDARRRRRGRRRRIPEGGGRGETARRAAARATAAPAPSPRDAACRAADARARCAPCRREGTTKARCADRSDVPMMNDDDRNVRPCSDFLKLQRVARSTLANVRRALPLRVPRHARAPPPNPRAGEQNHLLIPEGRERLSLSWSQHIEESLVGSGSSTVRRRAAARRACYRKNEKYEAEGQRLRDAFPSCTSARPCSVAESAC